MRNTTLYKLGKTRTFRRSSTMFFGYGGNLQNVKKELRSIYIPDGYRAELEAKCKYWLDTGDTDVFTEEELVSLNVFLQTDQAGAEALVVAYECEPKNFRQLFINGIKPHVYVAMILFKDIWPKKLKETGGLVEDFDIDALCATPIPLLKQNPFFYDLDRLIKDSDNWPLSERYYYFAKQTCHSANYGIEANTFRMNTLEKSGGKVVLSGEDSERFLMVYRALFPEIPERNRRILRQVEEHRLIYNTLGFPYQVTDWQLLPSSYKEYYAWPAQSTVAEITRRAYTNLQGYIESENKPFDILADTHDSYLTQCPLLHVRECRDKMQEFMQQELVSPFDGVKYRMKAEYNVGFNWSPRVKTKDEIKNPLGLQELKWLN